MPPSPMTVFEPAAEDRDGDAKGAGEPHRVGDVVGRVQHEQPVGGAARRGTS